MSRSQRYRRRRRGRGRHRSQALLAVMVVLIGVGIAGLSVVGWVAATAASAPSISTLKERDPGANTEVLAADGTRLGFISADYLSRPISGDRMPQVLKNATVAIEDERFYKHKGVDYEGIVRAAVKNFINQEDRRGRLDADDAAGEEPLHGRPLARAAWPATSARSARRSSPRSSRTSTRRSGSSTST